MKKLIQKLFRLIFHPKYEKFILFFLPGLALLISLCVLIPQISSLFYYASEQSASQQLLMKSVQKSQNTAEDRATVITTASPAPAVAVINLAEGDSAEETEQIAIHLTYVSTENDLYLFIRDSSETIVQGENFKIDVTYPNGIYGTYDSQADGTCYLVNLPAGTYQASVQQKAGYTAASPVNCTVQDKISYAAISEIEDIVEVVDASQIADEIKTSSSTAEQVTIAETITTSSEPAAADTAETPAEENADSTVSIRYSCSTGANGYILYADGTESDILPNEEDGQLVCGLKYDTESESYISVELFDASGIPLPLYQIQAETVSQGTSNESNAVVSTPQPQIVTGWATEGSATVYYLDDGRKAAGLKSIDGKLYYFDQNGRKASAIGIDVSFYNGTIDWTAVKKSGIDFVLIRVGGRGWSTGILYDDSLFYNYVQSARSVGLKIGVYFYSTAITRVEAVEEASIVLSRLAGSHLDYPIFIDMEYSGEYPNGRADRLSVAERVEIAQAFCETIQNSGYSSGIYASQYFLKDELSYEVLSKYQIWLANYTEDNRLPSFTGNWQIWQFTDKGRINGINGYADLNVVF